ncbi:MAG TPA: L-rhamnose/proton symporter RhaT [Candidatus Anammoximicrobium sp.]|nr:L-rhamnose/proton symporter RhaT [Candidatus Anammoximicrobium sp.]
MSAVVGLLVVALGGLIMGSGAWPFKLMRLYQFEHWWLIGMLVGLVVMPWTIVLAGCPHALQSLAQVPWPAILLGNLFSVGWGIANVLCGLCYVRIGVALTGAILAGLGVSVGALTPMIFKGSGLFQSAPDLTSPAGITVLVAVLVMLVGVTLASLAGFGRDRQRQKQQATSGGFLGGLVMTVVAGILSSFMAFVFVYSQDPIVANLSVVSPGSAIKVAVDGRPELSKEYTVADDGSVTVGQGGPVSVGGTSAAEAARRIAGRLKSGSQPVDGPVLVSTGSIPATFGVFAVGLIGGALVNVGYAVYLLSRNRSWGVLLGSGKEFLLAILIGVNFSLAVALMGKGMLLLGALGASIGFGIQQAMQMTGTQLLGFVSGEWRGVLGRPRTQMYLAIAVLIVAAAIMAYGNQLAQS